MITEDHDWGKAVVAGHPIRLWANLTTGRVVVQTDEDEPKEVGIAVDIDSDHRRGRMLVNSQQSQWADGLRDELLLAAIRRYNEVHRAGWDSLGA